MLLALIPHVRKPRKAKNVLTVQVLYGHRRLRKEGVLRRRECWLQLLDCWLFVRGRRTQRPSKKQRRDYVSIVQALRVSAVLRLRLH